MGIKYLKSAAMSVFLLIPLSATAVFVPPAQQSCMAPDGQVYVCSVICRDGLWIASTDGYEVRDINELVCTRNCHCKNSKEYRCATGYYGKANKSGTSGCVKCPCMMDTSGVNRCGSVAASNSKNITDCMMSSSYTFNDGVGSYQFVQDCAYGKK
jgi:hypothetical protein